MTHPLTIIGNEGSPYSRKMRAVLRYRNIPHRWMVSNGPEYVAPPKVPVEVIPVLVWHADDGAMRESMVDSTPQIARLEREYAGRSLRPADPALTLLASLIEDYGDEWCTKFMFHYRWADDPSIAWAREHLIRQINPASEAAAVDKFANWFAPRQIGRLGVVGSNEQTRAIIEGGYERLLAVLERFLNQRLFLFGQRPSAADFGVYGQLTQLCLFDPTSMRMARERAPRVVAWIERLEDLSGWRCEDSQWLPRDAALPALQPLLAEIGASYVPFMLANAAAKMAGQGEVECVILGRTWKQKVFPYQTKCLLWLREEFGRLNAEDQAWVREALRDSGCAALFA